MSMSCIQMSMILQAPSAQAQACLRSGFVFLCLGRLSNARIIVARRGHFTINWATAGISSAITHCFTVRDLPTFQKGGSINLKFDCCTFLVRTDQLNCQTWGSSDDGLLRRTRCTVHWASSLRTPFWLARHYQNGYHDGALESTS